MQKYWVSMKPKERVVESIEKGIMDSRGDEAHLNRMKKEDWVVFYSPREDLLGDKKLQTFTAMGHVTDETIDMVEIDGVEIFTRKFTYVATAKEISLIPLIQHLSFIKNKKHWGFTFKGSLIQIPETDFRLIAKTMVEEVL